MKTVLAVQLPMWLSFGFTVLGVSLSIMLARLAYGGILFTFTVLLTAGILVFGLHHLIELLGYRMAFLSIGSEVVSSAIFLGAAVYLGCRVRKIIYG